MLKLGSRTFSAPRAGAVDPALAHLLQAHRIGVTGRAYLTSILRAASQHVYRGKWSLVTSLVMRDRLAGAAKEVNEKLGFATGWSTTKLDTSLWRKGDRSTVFIARTAHCSKAVRATLLDKRKNALECERLVSLMALLAFERAAGAKWFNRLIAGRLGQERLTIVINGALLAMENLEHIASPGLEFDYTGDFSVRPGDLVAFGCNMSEAQGTQWQVENAICVGWKRLATGTDFSEPLYVGGGVAGALTEAKLKWTVYDNVRQAWAEKIKQRASGTGRPVSETDLKNRIKAHFEPRYGSDDQVKREFARNALDKSGSASTIVELNTTVTRLDVLGGRRDLHGQPRSTG